MLVGRERQIARLEEVLAAARGGRPGILRLVGGPGYGKTALVAAAVDSARRSGMTVVELVALESENDLPGTGLEILLRQLGADVTTTTPGALLAAIAAASADMPLLIALDDVQWLDAQTIAAIAFAARRLIADPVAVLLAGRPVVDTIGSLAPLPRLEVEPLPRRDSILLLRRLAPDLPAPTAAAIAEAFAGVPLALTEVHRLLPADVLQGVAPLPAPLPVGAVVQDRYARGFRELDPPRREALVLLAVDSGGDPAAIAAAAAAAGLPPTVFDAVEPTGLIRTDPTPAFVHPLARAAVHAAASPGEVRAAHRVLARVHSARGEHDTALRHRAAATRPPDAALARELELLATELLRTPASRIEASDVALLAARFSPAHADRVRLKFLAAGSGGPQRAQRIIAELQTLDLTPDERARCVLAKLQNDTGSVGQGMFRRSSSDFADAAPQLADVVRSPLSPAVAAECDRWSVWLAMETLDRTGLEMAVARLEARRDRTDGWDSNLALGQALTFLGEHGRAVPLLRRAVEMSGAVDPRTLLPDQLINWAVAPGWLMADDAEHARRFRTMDRLLRATGQPENVVSAAFFRAERARREGEWLRAETLLHEALEVSALVGEPDFTATAWLAGLLAFRGESDRVAELVASASRRSNSWSAWNSHWLVRAQGALQLTLGHPEQAAAILSGQRQLPFVGRGSRDHVAACLADLVECLAAIGDTAAASTVAAELADRLDGVIDPLGRALVLRARGLAEPKDAHDCLVGAIDLLASTTDVFESARTHLLLGEHLRRTRRPQAAREWLHRASNAFDQLGTPPWSQRARRELAATGERPAGPVPDSATAAALTPQETRVALAVADGMTNVEVAGSLFLSVKTVEFHLGRVYRKLGVKSRGGLAKALAAQGL